MNTLKLTLNKQWFDLIKKGIKTEEYREIKDYWFTRLCIGEFDNCEGQPTFKKFDKVEFTNGYNKKSPQVTFELLNITVDTGNVEWGAEPHKFYFVIKLGREVGLQNC